MAILTILHPVICRAILLWCISFSLPFCSSAPSRRITTTRNSGNETDRLALLAIKSQINQDPLGVTSSWNATVPMCQWKGVTCAHKHQRVTVLDLSNQKLRGFLSPYIGNLSFLRIVYLADNGFSGEIPPELGRLPRLESLVLANNSFSGLIPTNLSHCSNLVEFDASGNNLVGHIPAELSNLLKLQKLYIYRNHLTGELPAFLGNLSALRVISLKENILQGNLPHQLGQLKKLTHLGLGENQLSGVLPHSVSNISSFRVLAIGGNRFHGNLPPNLAFTLPNLQIFIASRNNFTGPLPESFCNASELTLLDLGSNSFSRKVSISSGGFKNIRILSLGDNNLGSGIVGDLDFVTSLTNCSKLQVLVLADNRFGGMLPHSIANLSTTLTQLYLRENQISGTIPLGISNLVNLNLIDMESNHLTGTIPQTVGKLQLLEVLAMGGNRLSGRIPPSLGNLSILSRLDLPENYLKGSIPTTLGKCEKIETLNLHQNRLSGTLPKEILTSKMLSIRLISLSDNLLTGSFPSEIGNLKQLIDLYIYGNQFSGEIPISLEYCTSLETLYADGNSFYGTIPTSLNSLRSLEEVDLSRNNLSGQIPKYFERLSMLTYLNLSFNHLEGEVPTGWPFNNASIVSLAGNDKLCGGPAELHLPSCDFKESKKSKPIKPAFIASGVLGFILLSSAIAFYWFKNQKRKKEAPSTFSSNSIPQISYHQLREATDGFSLVNLIGEGSFGQVYKGILNQNQGRNAIAVKVMNLQHRAASKSFIAECETLKNIRHRNLVKVISACSSIDFQSNSFKALIYEFMPNGSLERWLHAFHKAIGEPTETRSLNFLQRLNITIDVASALVYLHHQCHAPVVHCDLKPSNVLLDDDMVAHVGDFGLARFFPKSINRSTANQTSSIGLKGTVGYAAPEYGIGGEATTSGDVYSFGILILEVFTRKRPTDEMFKDGLTLHDFTKTGLPDQVTQIADPLLLHEANAAENGDGESSSSNPSRLRSRGNKMTECLISVLGIGVACSVESPKERMDINEAARELHSIRDKYLGTGIHTKTQR